MLKRLRRLMSRGIARNQRRFVGAEGLERRQLFDTTGPMLVKEQLVGPDPRAVEAVILTFNEPLDEASAEDLRHFRIGVRTDRRQDYDDEEDRTQGSSNGLINFTSAVYDEATLTVTLTPVKPFNITRKFRTIRVLGRENQTIRDLAGNRIDGNGDGRPGGDAIEKFTFRRGGRVSYGDPDGDSVSMRLEGPGLLWALRKTNGGRVLARGDALRVYIENGDPTRTIVTGKVTGRGNNVAVIDELVNVSSAAQVQLIGNPAFQINRVIA
jgi:hypothetical protein